MEEASAEGTATRDPIGAEPMAANGLSANSQTICGMSTDGLMLCKPAVSGDNPLPPTADCCSALAKADLPCMCTFKSSRMLPILGIKPDLAMGLPAKCNLPQLVHC
ncbi:hypothetical protein RJ640_016445 [Escallonia rubra]|uniref:Bifunctional inhibitor/plant lipid transfer protein/seed storage helical domain-containing protein n=1 Tax=Escallonia rubra TaxID=112253 RepID=A0AA88UCZ0_9ASTE|nr:hypothetical protein RJ640_016445 [Escallonia rubra]